MLYVSRQRGDADTAPTISLKDLLGSPKLREMWHFNDDIDVNWIMKHTHKECHGILESHFIYSATSFDERSSNSKNVISELANRDHWVFGHPIETPSSHNLRMIILGFQSYWQIVVHTAKLTPEDWNHSVDYIWISPELPSERGSSQRKNQFQADFLEMLQSYKTENLIQQLATKLKHANFSAIRDTYFVGSSPFLPSDKVAHLSRVRKLFGRTEKSQKIIAQVSRVGNVNVEWLKEFSSELNSDRPPQIVYPTHLNIKRAITSLLQKDKSSFHGDFAADLQELRPYLLPFEGVQSNRHRSFPHGNAYISFDSKSKDRMLWYMISTAGLVPDAWGTSTSPRCVPSWEAGVLIVRPCHVNSLSSYHSPKFSDGTLPLTFQYPVMSYRPQDEPAAYSGTNMADDYELTQENASRQNYPGRTSSMRGLNKGIEKMPVGPLSEEVGSSISPAPKVIGTKEKAGPLRLQSQTERITDEVKSRTIMKRSRDNYELNASMQRKKNRRIEKPQEKSIQPANSSNAPSLSPRRRDAPWASAPRGLRHPKFRREDRKPIRSAILASLVATDAKRRATQKVTSDSKVLLHQPHTHTSSSDSASLNSRVRNISPSAVSKSRGPTFEKQSADLKKEDSKNLTIIPGAKENIENRKKVSPWQLKRSPLIPLSTLHGAKPLGLPNIVPPKQPESHGTPGSTSS